MTLFLAFPLLLFATLYLRWFSNTGVPSFTEVTFLLLCLSFFFNYRVLTVSICLFLNNNRRSDNIRAQNVAFIKQTSIYQQHHILIIHFQNLATIFCFLESIKFWSNTIARVIWSILSLVRKLFFKLMRFILKTTCNCHLLITDLCFLGSQFRTQHWNLHGPEMLWTMRQGPHHLGGWQNVYKWCIWSKYYCNLNIKSKLGLTSFFSRLL